MQRSTAPLGFPGTATVSPTAARAETIRCTRKTLKPIQILVVNFVTKNIKHEIASNRYWTYFRYLFVSTKKAGIFSYFTILLSNLRPQKAGARGVRHLRHALVPALFFDMV